MAFVFIMVIGLIIMFILLCKFFAYRKEKAYRTNQVYASPGEPALVHMYRCGVSLEWCLTRVAGIRYIPVHLFLLCYALSGLSGLVLARTGTTWKVQVSS